MIIYNFRNLSIPTRKIKKNLLTSKKNTIFAHQNAESQQMPQKSDIFQFSQHWQDVFLLGVFRTDKPQLDWILDSNQKRGNLLYNIRYNDNLFADREGGFHKLPQPQFIILYEYQHPEKGIHLFPCIKTSVVSQQDMENLSYPQPNGAYILFELQQELIVPNIDIQTLLGQNMHISQQQLNPEPILLNGSEIQKYIAPGITTPFANKQTDIPTLRFIDLFAGIGGIRKGLEQAAYENGLKPVCVFTSEIKPYAIKVLHDNHPLETIAGDITQIKASDIPDFDILCAGLPCQALSSAGKRNGFADTRGTLFFEVERILKEKKPQGFILENVEGLVNHDGGRTLDVILNKLQSLNYHINYRVLNAKNFGVPQERKRIYIIGSLHQKPNLDDFPQQSKTLQDVLEQGMPTLDTPFIQNLLVHFDIQQLYGKSIKDKRGGNTNIHSWDIALKGEVSLEEKKLLNAILTNRRQKKWAAEIGIDWMDGMPLTTQQIKTFYPHPHLQKMLTKLTKQGYLSLEHPKKLVKTTHNDTHTITTHREYDTTKPKGYNIIAGKLSFEINKILAPNQIAPTLVAMDMNKLYVADNGGLRTLTLREGLRLNGYPDDFIFNVSQKEGYDLLGNTVVVPVIKAVAERLLQHIILQ